jgi:hypothetical protein
LAEGGARFSRAGEKVDRAHPFICGDAMARGGGEGGFVSVRVSGKRGEKVVQ